MINMVRGDTLSLQFQRKDLDGDVITDTPSSIYFTVKESYFTPAFVLQKTIANMQMDNEGVWHFSIAPAETESLPYGDYVFDIEVTDNGAVTTIAKGVLRLEGEVTWEVNR